METKQIKVIIKKPYNAFEIAEIKDNFQEFRKVIGCKTLESCSFPQDSSIKMLLDEEGKIFQLNGNFMVPEYKDCIVGTCIFTSFDTDGEPTSLTNKQIEKVSKYLNDYSLKYGEDLYTQHESLIGKSIRKMQKNKEEDLC